MSSSEGRFFTLRLRYQLRLKITTRQSASFSHFKVDQSTFFKWSSSYETRMPEENSGLNGILTHDLCDAGPVLYQLSYRTNLADNFSGFFLQLLLSIHNCKGFSFMNSFICSSNIYFTYFTSTGGIVKY